MSYIFDFVIEKGVLKKYTGSGGDVVIPQGVTTIGRGAFIGCDNVTSVTIPDGVTTIGDCAFAYCHNLIFVKNPDSVTEIGAEAFSHCDKLRAVNIPDGVERMSRGLFNFCENLEQVNIPNSTTYIGNGAFWRCFKLASLHIPDGVTIIGNEAFGCSGLTSVSLPESVTEIKYGAFAGCENLQSVTISDHVTKIEKSVFRGCKKLTTLAVSEQVTEIESGTYSDTALTSVIIPDNIKIIGEDAFSFCNNLTDVTLGIGVTDVGKLAFGYCVNLKRLHIPNVKTLCGITFDLEGNPLLNGADLFLDGCELREIAIPKGVTKIMPHAFAGSRVQSVVIPEGVTEIGEGAFRKCSQLSYVSLPSTVKKISPNAFAYCPLLKNIEISPQNRIYRCEDGILIQKGNTLISHFHMENEIRYVVPDYIETIEKEAFWSPALKEIRAGVRVKTIRGMAICCYNLERIWLPKVVEKVAAQSIQFNPLIIFCNPALAAKFSKNRIAYLGEIEDIPVKQRNAAACGYIEVYGMDPKAAEPWCDSYADYMKRNSKTYLKQLRTNETMLRIMLIGEALPQREIDSLIDAYSKKKKTELVSELLEYKRVHFRDNDVDLFSLSEQDTQTKRMEMLVQRQEELKNIVGIQGIVFVASGEFMNFGEYDEYTGAKDLSDLKAYIEARGGFLRSAVSSKTDYLICNDPDSESRKMLAAKEMGISVISEKVFLEMAGKTK